MRQNHEQTSLDLILPQASNPYGTLFAGEALSRMAKAAAIAAMQHAKGPAVMAHVSGVDFLSPVLCGDLLSITARIIRQGRSSMTVEVAATAAAAGADCPRNALLGRFEMVAVDAAGQPRTLQTSLTDQDKS